MERLTRATNNNKIHSHEPTDYGNDQDRTDLLGEYEDLGMTPEEIIEQIEILKHNYKSMEDTLGRQCNNALKIVNKLEKDCDYWKREAIKAKAQLGEIRILAEKSEKQKGE